MSADSYYDCPKCGGENTFREDYEQGLLKYNGEFVFFVDYYGKCENCYFTHKFNHKEDLNPELLE